MNILRMLLAVLLLATSSASALAQTEQVAGEESGNDALRKLLDQSVTWFEFIKPDSSSRPLQSRIVLRWTNNARASNDGLTVIWIEPSGRPAAIAAIFPYDDMFCYEFNSLSRGTFRATRHGEPYWSPEKPGLQFTVMDEAPMPAPSKGGRLLQMKRLARQYDATMLGWSTKVNQSEELRLLPRPLYRYEVENSESVMGGALFAFTSGTDPEVVMVIEAVRQGTQTRWECAFARRTSGALEVRRDDTIVWQANAYPDGGNPSKTNRGGRQPLAPLLAEQE